MRLRFSVIELVLLPIFEVFDITSCVVIYGFIHGYNINTTIQIIQLLFKYNDLSFQDLGVSGEGFHNFSFRASNSDKRELYCAFVIEKSSSSAQPIIKIEKTSHTPLIFCCSIKSENS